MKRWVCALFSAWLVLGLLGARDASAHDLRPGVLSLAETGAGAYGLHFVPPVDNRGETVEVTIELPPNCVRSGEGVHCDGELAGAIAVRGMRGDAMRTIVQLERLDGSRAEWIVSAESPHAILGEHAPRTWLAWVRIGVEHILGGYDHVAFVLGLLLVLGLTVDRRLLATLSAFTLAHSVTLALAALGVVHVAIGPVEACIALSVLMVAREAMHRDPTAIRRWPWLAAAGFGLIHGLGFASALGELGLPRASLASSLLCFNVGVELGQLAIVAAVVVLANLGRRLMTEHAAPRIHTVACYGLGSLAAWWFVARVALI